jgi:DeoR family transcriptional regulator, catabolite repression regulator
MKDFKVLDTVSLCHVDRFFQSYATRYSLESPAICVLTDFTARKPLMLESSTLVSAAIEVMRSAHVKLKMVVDEEEKFLGIISFSDLQSIKVGKAAVSKGVSPKELIIEDIMTNKQHLFGINILDIDGACVGDIINTLKYIGEQHILVISEDQKTIRGLISAADISRLLHIKFDITETAHTFSDVFNALKAS